MPIGREVFLALAAIPFIYYLIALYSSWRYFRQPGNAVEAEFTPPVSILKPIRGLDKDAYDNLASFCRLDYPEYEIVCCVDPDDQAVLGYSQNLRGIFRNAISGFCMVPGALRRTIRLPSWRAW